MTSNEIVNNMKRTFLMAAGLVMMFSAAAQQRPERPDVKDPPKRIERPTVEQEAQMKTDRMASELTLDEKQIKKVKKFLKKDIEYRRENFEFGGPRPEGKFPVPPSGGRGGFPGGGPGGMGPGGKGPGGGGFPGGGPGMRPGNPPSGKPAFGGEVDYEQLEKYNAKQDKKLRKIIGDKNFEQWRASHPLEAPKMPDLELKK